MNNSMVVVLTNYSAILQQPQCQAMADQIGIFQKSD